jgi:hypothetical protein
VIRVESCDLRGAAVETLKYNYPGKDLFASSTYYLPTYERFNSYLFNSIDKGLPRMFLFMKIASDFFEKLSTSTLPQTSIRAELIRTVFCCRLGQLAERVCETVARASSKMPHMRHYSGTKHPLADSTESKI